MTSMITDVDVQICANEKCGNSVPESRNRGVKRIYCSARCGRQVASRRFYQREVPGGSHEQVRDPSRGPQVTRRKAFTAKQAEKIFKEHSQKCPKSPDGKCPDAMDSYTVERRCLLRSVLFEDWNELRRIEKGFDSKPRYLTTEDGCWLPEEVTIRERGYRADFYDDLRAQGKLHGFWPLYSL